MATLGGDILTLADIQKQLDPNGMVANFADLLAQSNPILDDIPWVPSNLPTAHRSTINVGLPTTSLRRVNEGVAATKATFSQIEDGMSLLNSWSHTDAKLLELSGDPAAIRFNQSRAFIESMGQKATELIFYGDEASDDKEFNGFRLRSAYSTLANDNVFDAGDTNANVQSSIWLIGWAPDKIFGIYPQHTSAGLAHRDHGLKPWSVSTDAAPTTIGSATLSAFIDEWSWDMGLVVKDWRYAVRIANVSDSDVLNPGSTNQGLTAYTTNIMYLMARAMHRIPNLSACNPVFYMPRSLMEGFDVQALARTTANVFATEQVEGKVVTTYRGIPMKVVDQLTYTEPVVT